MLSILCVVLFKSTLKAPISVIHRNILRIVVHHSLLSDIVEVEVSQKAALLERLEYLLVQGVVRPGFLL